MGATCGACYTGITDDDDAVMLMRPSIKMHFDVEDNLGVLIKVQAAVRAYLARKKYAKMRNRTLFGGRNIDDSMVLGSYTSQGNNYESQAVQEVT